MLLRYPFGDFIEECKDYAVTEILLTCSDQDRTVSGDSDPVYNVCSGTSVVRDSVGLRIG